MLLPIVSVIGITNSSSDDLIKKILRCDSLPTGTSLGNNVTGYKWLIDTKYYTAETYMCSIDASFDMPNNLQQMVEAIIIYFDSEQEDAIPTLHNMENFMKKYHADVLLLVCDSFNSNGANKTREAALNWCLKHHFELIELNPSDAESPAYVDDLENDEIIPEKIGIERVVEALQTHHWVNAVMKGDSNLDDSSDDFTELFSQLLLMKEGAQSLPLNERRAHAEQVVAAFWRAIGGDEEELAGLTE